MQHPRNDGFPWLWSADGYDLPENMEDYDLPENMEDYDLPENMVEVGYLPPISHYHPNQNGVGLLTNNPIPILPINVTGTTTNQGTTTIAESTSTGRPLTHICAFCQIRICFTTRGALKRHINQQHGISEYSYQCPLHLHTEAGYVSCNYKHSRRYKAKKHIADKHHHDSEPIRLNESSYPHTCSLCPQYTFLSWKAWWEHFERHCRL